MKLSKPVLGLSVFIICMTLSVWVYTKKPAIKKLDEATLASTADLFIHKLTMRQFDKDGQLMHELQSPYVHHIPNNDTHVAQSPHVVIAQENQPPRDIRAEEATTHENGKKITLKDNVLVHQEKNAQTEESTLKAASADLNLITYTGVFTGDVELDQGTTHVRAARAITYGDKNNQLTKAIIYGDKEKQAHFWATPETGKAPMHAYADIIYYYPDRHRIELIGHAKIGQGNDSFSAPSIFYDTLDKHIVSKSNDKQRTTIIIHPGKTP